MTQQGVFPPPVQKAVLRAADCECLRKKSLLYQAFGMSNTVNTVNTGNTEKTLYYINSLNK